MSGRRHSFLWVFVKDSSPTGENGMSRKVAPKGHTGSYYLTCVQIGKHLQTGTFLETLTGQAIEMVGMFSLGSLIEHGRLSTETLTGITRICEISATSANDLARMCRKEFLWDTNPLIAGDWDKLKKAVAARGMPVLDSFEKHVALTKLMCDRLQDVAKMPLHMALQADYDLESKLAEGVPQAFKENWLFIAKGMLVETGRHNAFLRGIRLRTAIKRYSREHGRTPDSLGDLQPQFIKEPLLDPFSGTPFKYKRTEDGWVLWSIGPDLTDDGPHDEDPDDRSRLGKDDIVFRSQLPTNIEVQSR